MMQPLYSCPKCGPGTSWQLEKLNEQEYWCGSCKIGIFLQDDRFKTISRTLLIRIMTTFRFLIFIGLAYFSPAILVGSLYSQVFGSALVGFKYILALLPGVAVGAFIFFKTQKSFTRFSDEREMLKTFKGGRLSRWKRRGRAR